MSLTNLQITEIALANGFKLKEQPDGSLALNPYVFDFAKALVDASRGEVTYTHKPIGVFPSFGATKTIIGFDAILGKPIVSPTSYSRVLVRHGELHLVVLVNQIGGNEKVNLLGGLCKASESYEQCALRIVHENTGCLVELVDRQPHVVWTDSGTYCRTYLVELTLDEYFNANSYRMTSNKLSFVSKQYLLDNMSNIHVEDVIKFYSNK